MSRLKGADLGVAVPAGTLNYRGKWSASPSPSYAVNDVVLRNGVLYAAALTPGSLDPAGIGGNPTLVQRSPGSFSSPTFSAATSVNNSVLVVYMSQNPANNTVVPVAPAGYTLIHDTGVDPIQGKRHMYFLAQPGAIGSVTAVGFTNTSGTWIGDAFEFAGPVSVSFAADVAVTATAATISATNPNQSYALACSGSALGTNVSSGAISQLTTDGGSAPDTFWSLQPASANPSFTFTGASSAGILLSLALIQTVAWAPLASLVESANFVAASGAAVTLPDVTTATMHRVTLSANTAITLPTPGVGKSFTVELRQDATGGRTVAWATPAGAIRWPGGTAPTITATANGIDVITFVCIGGTNWYGFVAGQAFA